MNNGFAERVSSGRPEVKAHCPFVISFSGIDGAGKTTHIEYLSSFLQEQGLRVLRLSFWDHVAAWSRMRSEVGEQAASFHREDQKAEYAFSPKNHKHIQKWYLTAARSGLYVLDLVRLRRLLKSQDARNHDVVIFDRYLYDQVANIDARSFLTGAYVSALLKQTPCPDLAFLLDAPPALAFARKQEYPLEFMHRNRRAFLNVAEFLPRLITISGSGIEEVRTKVLMHVRRVGLLRDVDARNFDAAGVRTVGASQSCCRQQTNQQCASEFSSKPLL